MPELGWWLPGIIRDFSGAIEALRLQNAAIITNVNLLLREVRAMSGSLQAAIDRVQAAVERNNTIEASAETLIKSIPDLIQHAMQQSQAAGATAEQLQALDDLATGLQSKAQELADAVTANTPHDSSSGGGASPITNGGNPTANTGTADAGGAVDNAGTV